MLTVRSSPLNFYSDLALHDAYAHMTTRGTEWWPIGHAILYLKIVFE